jgi:polyisoprenyl-phosphate glycosyltransferase
MIYDHWNSNNLADEQNMGTRILTVRGTPAIIHAADSGGLAVGDAHIRAIRPMTEPNSVALSIVVPCYNERDCVDACHQRLDQVCRQARLRDYEIVFVNDGSTDETLHKLIALQTRDPHVVIVDLARNHGHQLALSAGLSLARGARTLVIDADLQDPPELLPDMMRLMDEGADVVYGERIERKGESLFKKLTAKLFYRFLARSTNVDIPLDTGDFRLMNRAVLDVLNRMPEAHRFVRGMVAWIGFKQVPLRYTRVERFAGATKYPLHNMIRLALDAVTAFAIAPLRFAFGIALFAVTLAFVLLGWSVHVYLFHNAVPGWSSLMVVFLFFTAVQLLSVAIIGEYIGRIFIQTKGRPLFVVRKVYAAYPKEPRLK